MNYTNENSCSKLASIIIQSLFVSYAMNSEINTKKIINYSVSVL